MRKKSLEEILKKYEHLEAYLRARNSHLAENAKMELRLNMYENCYDIKHLYNTAPGFPSYNHWKFSKHHNYQREII